MTVAELASNPVSHAIKLMAITNSYQHVALGFDQSFNQKQWQGQGLLPSGAELPENVELLMGKESVLLFQTPPPARAELLEKVQLLILRLLSPL